MFSQVYKEEFSKYLEEIGEVGFVDKITPPIVYAKGLPGVRNNEVVYFESGEMGMVFSIGRELVEILVFSRNAIRIGTRISRTSKPLQVPVGDSYLGKSVDSLGKSIHAGVIIPEIKEYRDIEDTPAGIEKRKKINRPLETGVAVVDLMVPLGLGQRELVLGDRKTGKSEFLMQVLLSQARSGSICIYACIGKRKSDVKRIEDFIIRNELGDTTCMVVTSSTDPTALIMLTPYYAMTLAEYFRDQGKHVLVIMDDLSTHAKYYREISLVGRRFPGREAYPGDIFYIHSRLLERAGNFDVNGQDISITCLPVTETVESDISGYIQTNLMSITDGHIYFDKELFEQGRRPSVNYFLSVTRVGRQTQNKLRWGVNRELSSFLTLLEKTLRFIHFGAEVNEGIKATMSMGTKLLSFFEQPMGQVVTMNMQILIYSLIWVGQLTGGENSSSLRLTVDKSLSLYAKDPEFRNMVDEVITKTDDFNVLLGKVSSSGKNIVNYIETH